MQNAFRLQSVRNQAYSNDWNAELLFNRGGKWHLIACMQINFLLNMQPAAGYMNIRCA